MISTFPYTYPNSPLLDFTLALSGSTIGQISSTPTVAVARMVTPISGSPLIWSDTNSTTTNIVLDPILLSPDGTLIAEYTGIVGVGGQAANPSTNIIQNGTLITAVPGAGVGWIDNTHLLANQWIPQFYGNYVYGSSTIYSSTGQVLGTPPLPEIVQFQDVSSDSIYVPQQNSIYSLTTGQPLWTGTYPSSGIGAVSGSLIVYESGTSIVIESY